MQLTLDSITKSYRDAERTLTIIDALSFTFPEKGGVGIVGRSGVGKSTLLHILGGLDLPTAGAVRYGDTSLHALSDDGLAHFRGENIGFIFQGHHLLPEFSAVENVAMPLIIRGTPKRIALQRASEVLALVGLAGRATHRPGQLSGGEQQRVAIARAVVCEPKVILADEPTGSLDVKTAEQIQNLLLSLKQQMNALVIVVTHSLELARALGSVYEMVPGGALKQV